MSGEVKLVLGCFGRTDEDFISCKGIQNTILLIKPNDIFYNDMMEFFDNLKLFDRTIFDLNSSRHIIFNLKDRFEMPHKPLWHDKMFNLYQKFILEHKNCGIFIKLELP